MVRGGLAAQPLAGKLGRLLGRRSTEGELAQAIHNGDVCLGGVIERTSRRSV